MSDERMRAAYAEFLSSGGTNRTDCPSPEALLAIADGSASEAERLTTLRHVGRCLACRADLDLLRTTHVAAEAAAVPRWRMPALIAAAAVVIVASSLAVREATRGEPIDVTRDATRSGVQLLTPAEDVVAALPVRLVWSALPDARRYDVEILTPGGQVVYTASTRDTVLTVPPGIVVPGSDYVWWVVAALPEGRRESLTRRLRIAR